MVWFRNQMKIGVLFSPLSSFGFLGRKELSIQVLVNTISFMVMGSITVQVVGHHFINPLPNLTLAVGGQLSSMVFLEPLLALRTQMEGTKELIHIFWISPSSTMLVQSFSSLVIADCTYKTNKWKMPLFHLAGLTSTGQTFTIAFAFLSDETAPSYAWALARLRAIYHPKRHPSIFIMDNETALITAIEVVFPLSKRVQCSWHIGRNVLMRITKANKEKNKKVDADEVLGFNSAWKDILEAHREKFYKAAVEKLCRGWGKEYPGSCITLKV